MTQQHVNIRRFGLGMSIKRVHLSGSNGHWC